MSTLLAPLLRTMAAVPISSRVLCLERNPERQHAIALAKLGFSVVAPPMDGATKPASTSFPEFEGQLDVLPENGNIHLKKDAYNWIVAIDALPRKSSQLADRLEDLYPTIQPGGWIYLAYTLKPSGNAELLTEPADLDELATDSGWEVAQKAELTEWDDQPVVHAIYRRVEEGVAR